MEDRFVSAVEVTLATLCLTVVALRGGVNRVGLGVFAASIAASAVNLHTFPLMAWYTVDGILLIAAGFVFTEQGVASASRWRVLAGLLLLGLASTTKQSFAPAAFLGLAGAIWRRHRWGGRRDRQNALMAIAATGLAPGAYVVAIFLSGGLPDLLTQATSGDKGILLTPIEYLLDPATLTGLLGAAMLVTLAIVLQRTPRVQVGNLALVATCVASALVVLVTLPPLGSRYDTTWGWVSFWLCVVACGASSVVDRRPDTSGFLIVSVAWMVSLSWGDPVPNLVAGSLALVTLLRLWERVRLPKIARAIRAISMVVGSGVIVAVILVARTVLVYRDLPASDLSVHLDSVGPAFAGLVTNPTTAAYLAEVRMCVARYPAARVAILPDGAGLYPALGLRPALPIDWLWPADYQGSEARIVGAASELSRAGDALILWQTVDAGRLDELAKLPAATLASLPFDRDPGLSTALRQALGGLNRTCGSFLVRYMPAHSLWVPNGS
jgi:hypothetical protein